MYWVPPVRVEHKPVRGIPFFVSLFKGTHDQLCIRFGSDMPGNDLSGKEVHHNAQIKPFTASLDIGDIADPNEVGSFLPELLLQVIGTGSIVSMSAVNRRFRSGHLWQLQVFHQSVHSSDTDMDAIITL